LRADDAAAVDVRRAGLVDRVQDAEGFQDGERVVGEELAAELIARKGIAIEQGHTRAALREERRERRAGRSGADDGDVDVGGCHPEPRRGRRTFRRATEKLLRRLRASG
jgi:hypothetical protein